MLRRTVSPISGALTDDATSDCPSSRATTCAPDSSSASHALAPPLSRTRIASVTRAQHAEATPTAARPCPPLSALPRSEASADCSCTSTVRLSSAATHAALSALPRQTSSQSTPRVSPDGKPEPLMPATRRCITDEVNRSGFYPQLSGLTRSAVETSAGPSSPSSITPSSCSTAFFASAQPSPRAAVSAYVLSQGPMPRAQDRLTPPPSSQSLQQGQALTKKRPPSPTTSSSGAVVSTPVRPTFVSVLPPSTPEPAPPQRPTRTVCLPCAGGVENDASADETANAEEEVFDVTEEAKKIVMTPERVHITPLTRTYLTPDASRASTPRGGARGVQTSSPMCVLPSRRTSFSSGTRRRSSAGSTSVTGAGVVIDGQAVLKQTLTAMEKTLWRWVESGCVRLRDAPSSARGLARVEQYRGPLPVCLQGRPHSRSRDQMHAHRDAHAAPHRTNVAMGECVLVKTVAVFLPTSEAAVVVTAASSEGSTQAEGGEGEESDTARALTEAVLRPSLAIYLWHLRHLQHPNLATVVDVHSLHGALHEEKRNEHAQAKLDKDHGTPQRSLRTDSSETDSEDELQSGAEVLRYRISHRTLKVYTPAQCRVRLADLAARDWCESVPTTHAWPHTTTDTIKDEKMLCMPGAHHAQTVFLLARAYVPAPACDLQAYLRSWRDWALPPLALAAVHGIVSPPNAAHTQDDAESEEEDANASKAAVPRALFGPRAWAFTMRFHHLVADVLSDMLAPLLFLHRHTRPSTTPDTPRTRTRAKVDASARLRVIHGNLKPANVLLSLALPTSDAAAVEGAPGSARTTLLSPTGRAFEVCLTDFALPMIAPIHYDARRLPLIVDDDREGGVHDTAASGTDTRCASRSDSGNTAAPTVRACVYRCLRRIQAKPFFTYGSHAPSPAHPHAPLDVRESEVTDLCETMPYVAPENLVVTHEPRDVCDDASGGEERLWVLDAEAWMPASDAFALGALWFALLTGEAPPTPPCAYLSLGSRRASRSRTVSSPCARAPACEVFSSTTVAQSPEDEDEDGGEGDDAQQPRRKSTSIAGSPYTAQSTAAPLGVNAAQLVHCTSQAQQAYLRGILEVLVAHVFSCEFMTAELLELAQDVNQLGFTGRQSRVAVAALVARFAGTREAADVAHLSCHTHHTDRTGAARVRTPIALPSCLFPYRASPTAPTEGKSHHDHVSHGGALDDIADSEETNALTGQALFAMLCMTEKSAAASAIYEALLGLLDPCPRTRWTLKQFQRSVFRRVFGTSPQDYGSTPRADAHYTEPARSIGAASPRLFSTDPSFEVMKSGPAFRWRTRGAHRDSAWPLAEERSCLPSAARRSSWESLSPTMSIPSSPSAPSRVGAADVTAVRPANAAQPIAHHATVPFLVVVFALKVRRRAHFAHLKKVCAARQVIPERGTRTHERVEPDSRGERALAAAATAAVMHAHTAVTRPRSRSATSTAAAPSSWLVSQRQIGSTPPAQPGGIHAPPRRTAMSVRAVTLKEVHRLAHQGGHISRDKGTHSVVMRSVRTNLAAPTAVSTSAVRRGPHPYSPFATSSSLASSSLSRASGGSGTSHSRSGRLRTTSQPSSRLNHVDGAASSSRTVRPSSCIDVCHTRAVVRPPTSLSSSVSRAQNTTRRVPHTIEQPSSQPPHALSTPSPASVFVRPPNVPLLAQPSRGITVSSRLFPPALTRQARASAPDAGTCISTGATAVTASRIAFHRGDGEDRGVGGGRARSPFSTHAATPRRPSLRRV